MRCADLRRFAALDAGSCGRVDKATRQPRGLRFHDIETHAGDVFFSEKRAPRARGLLVGFVLLLCSCNFECSRFCALQVKKQLLKPGGASLICDVGRQSFAYGIQIIQTRPKKKQLKTFFRDSEKYWQPSGARKHMWSRSRQRYDALPPHLVQLDFNTLFF